MTDDRTRLEPDVAAFAPAVELYNRAASVRAVTRGEVNRFTQCIERLQGIAQEIDSPIAIAGGLAAIRHGAKVTTLDVDIVVSRDKLEEILAVAPRHGFTVRRRSPNGWHLLRFPHPEEDVDVHVIPEGEKSPRDPPGAPTNPSPRELGVESGVGYAEFAPWVQMKLVAAREKDRYHLVEVLKDRSEKDIAEVVTRLRKLGPAYLREFERLVRAAEDEKDQENW